MLARHQFSKESHLLIIKRAGVSLREKQVDALPAWLESARTSEIKEMRQFTQGIERDRAAVEAGLSRPESQGQTEGHVTRLKLIKREMYGRAKFDLLRLRVMYAA